MLTGAVDSLCYGGINMKRLFRMTGLLLLAFTMLAIPAGGEGNIQVLSSTADPTFAENIIFRLQAESSSPITEVILFYRDTLEAATNRAYPS